MEPFNILNDVELFWLLTLDKFEMERSKRRGGENRARLDFSARRAVSQAFDCIGFFSSSCVGLKNSARFDVSRVAVPILGATVTNCCFFALFFSELGVFRPISVKNYMLHHGTSVQYFAIIIPGVRRWARARRFGVATFPFRLNFLKIRNDCVIKSHTTTTTSNCLLTMYQSHTVFVPISTHSKVIAIGIVNWLTKKWHAFGPNDLVDFQVMPF